jgi:hypothetical protein
LVPIVVGDKTHLLVLDALVVLVKRRNVPPDPFDLGNLPQDLPLVLEVDAVEGPVPLKGAARRKRKRKEGKQSKKSSKEVSRGLRGVRVAPLPTQRPATHVRNLLVQFGEIFAGPLRLLGQQRVELRLAVLDLQLRRRRRRRREEGGV